MPARDREKDGSPNQQHWRVDRTVAILGLVTIAGAALVAVGWIIQGRSYLPGLLLQLGTSMMLLVPLALLALMLENRIGRAEEQIHAAAQRLDNLTAVTRQQLAGNRRHREELFDEAKRTTDQERIRILLGEALKIGAIASSGIRVQLPGSLLRLRFCPEGSTIRVQLEEPNGTAFEPVVWNEAESATTLALRLAERLRALGRYPGDANFDPAAVLRQLLDVIHIGIRARTGEYPHDLGHLIEIPNHQWAISTEGLFSTQNLYHISAQSISRSHEDWPRYMRKHAWVNINEFEEAYQLARKLLLAPRRGGKSR